MNFPTPFEHNHPPVRDVNQLYKEQESFGERLADRVANFIGSWQFIIIQSGILVVWLLLNSLALALQWDPYPFILMNLVLSTEAAFSAPIIMMSQNRQAEKDRLVAHNDYLLNQKSELEIRAVLEHLVAQDQALDLLHKMLLELQSRSDGSSSRRADG